MYRVIPSIFTTTIKLKPSYTSLVGISSIVTRPLQSTRSIRPFSSTIRTMSEDDPKTVRPPHKRVRSSDEHVDPGNTAQPLSKSDQMKDGEVPEWLTQPPFSYNQSWNGWDKKWRSSCWCGKSESHIAHLRRYVTDPVLAAFSFSGDPLQVKACHCDDCQRLHGKSSLQMATWMQTDGCSADHLQDPPSSLQLFSRKTRFDSMVPLIGLAS